MNLYAVVEGRRTEMRLFRAWLPFLLPGYQEVQRVEDFSTNTFLLVSGNGYPSYLNIVRQAVRDCRQQPACSIHLMVCADAEDVGCLARAEELAKTIEEDPAGGTLFHSIIIAECCIETWLLGNRRIVSRYPQSQVLRDYLAHYDIVQNDPEALPHKTTDRNRAETHLNYLRAVFAERGIAYTKRDPGEAASRPYCSAPGFLDTRLGYAAVRSA